MKISEILDPKAIVADLQAKDKPNALRELTDSLLSCEPTLNRDDVIAVLEERERLGSTGIGDGVAIPHGKLAGIPELKLVFGRSRSGVDFDSMDGQPAYLFFLLIAPEESVGIHLKTLARISKLLKDAAVRKKLLEAADQKAIYQVILDAEG
ncbi:PTS IIA-like nitrogen-regulatory protein PtsN [Desulfuromusa kysingii]|uniref:PTS IIA-like nitrogen-regulatory protein PtsN n=1 Tax=Desulfuromusa kysingii TaxID=37625 RepID=A0A1H3ZN98_9BACT|nr:PTS sugar transporter subunit IIA [Desulfuromusa kysingii]SEA25249.1 PTS IIA-like nitrogen-regulatory protein PtsN [Desulfuromusa kysingii]